MSQRKPPQPPRKAEVCIVRSSAAEYLTFIAASGQGGVEAVFAEENVWITQKMMALLNDVGVRTINYDLKNVLSDSELEGDSVIRNFRITVSDCKSYNTHPRADVIDHRADADRPNMGPTSWKEARLGKIQKFDAVVAKNYLTEHEMAQFSRLVNAYLDVAENMAQRKIPMTLRNWEIRLNRFIEATDREVLQDAGKITAEVAKVDAESEIEKYRIVQDRLSESDFDRLLYQIEPGGTPGADKD